MGTVSARLPDDLEAELEQYIEAENLDRSTAIRKLLAESLEDWRHERALRHLEAGEITLSRAAELTGSSVWDVAAMAKEEGVSWVGHGGLEDDLDEL